MTPSPSLIQQTLLERGMSVSDLARRAGVTRQTVYNWIRGAAMRPEHAKRVSEILDIPGATLTKDIERDDLRLLADVCRVVIRLARERNIPDERLPGLIAGCFEICRSNGAVDADLLNRIVVR